MIFKCCLITRSLVTLGMSADIIVREWEVINFGDNRTFHYLSYAISQEDRKLYDSLELFIQKCIRKHIKIIDTEIVKLLKPYASKAYKMLGKDKFFEGLKRLIKDIADCDIKDLYVEADKINYKMR